MPKCNHAKSSKFSVYLMAIDDREVSHPTEFDFYLQSHGSSLGTSCPAHHIVPRMSCPAHYSMMNTSPTSPRSPSATLMPAQRAQFQSLPMHCAARWRTPPMTAPRPLHDSGMPTPMPTPARRHEQDQSQSALHTPHPLPTEVRSQIDSVTGEHEHGRVGHSSRWPIAPWLRNNPPTDFPRSQRGGCQFGDCERESAPGVLTAGDDCVAQPWTS
ncbi:hypothetical protein B0H10DRAFT_1961001 [Mycena sp. CBHHK59/15]|nr:hypothetical protein B0H10DRAFT_1961001 [Mycena sp. CBHHK59/15]